MGNNEGREDAEMLRKEGMQELRPLLTLYQGTRVLYVHEPTLILTPPLEISITVVTSHSIPNGWEVQ